MNERLKQIETIARACGWETEIRDGQFIEVTESDVIPFNFTFAPFVSEDHWFRAFDAMGLKDLILVKVTLPETAWVCALAERVGDPEGVEAKHPDRLTAMALALHAAARAKLGEVEG